MAINKIEMQDTNGNALYPHTSGDLVNYDSSKTVNQKIDEAIANLNSLKSSLATAVNNKTGSSLSSSSTIADITAKVNTIVTLSSGSSDATATASQILSGSTAYVKGSKVTGTMTNQGAKTSALSCGGSYTIPAGYHNGSGKVTADSLSSQTSATASAGNILSGLTAYVNGNKITGTMPNISSSSSITYETNNSTKVVVGDQAFGPITNTDGVSRVLIRYNSTNGYITGNTLVGVSTSNMASQLGITASKIVSGNTICGIAGTATASSLGGMKVVTGQATSSSTRDRRFVLYQLSGSTTTLASLVVSGLSFRPKYAMFYATDRFSWRSICVVDTLATIGGKLGGMFTATNGTDVSTSGSNCPYQDNTWMITDNGIIAGTSMTSTVFNYIIIG